eukprot:8281850-Pyramimonas_sp.AAC.1
MNTQGFKRRAPKTPRHPHVVTRTPGSPFYEPMASVKRGQTFCPPRVSACLVDASNDSLFSTRHGNRAPA